MRTVFLVYGKNHLDSLPELQSLLEARNPNTKFIRIDVSGNAQEILEKVFEVIRENGYDYLNMLTIISGENTHLLDTNMPCDKVNLGWLIRYFGEAIYPKGTPQHKDMTSKMLVGALTELTKSE